MFCASVDLSGSYAVRLAWNEMFFAVQLSFLIDSLISSGTKFLSALFGGEGSCTLTHGYVYFIPVVIPECISRSCNTVCSLTCLFSSNLYWKSSHPHLEKLFCDSLWNFLYCLVSSSLLSRNIAASTLYILSICWLRDQVSHQCKLSKVITLTCRYQHVF